MIIIKFYLLMTLITIFLLYTTNFIIPIFRKKDTLYDRVKKALEQNGVMINSFSAKSGVIFGIIIKFIKMGLMWFYIIPQFIVSIFVHGKGEINVK